MSTQPVKQRSVSKWPGLAAVLGLVLLGAGGFYFRWPVASGGEPEGAVVAAVPAAGVHPSVPTPVAVAPAPITGSGVLAAVAPTFDIVRVTPEGSTVIAGRAEPGAEVMVREGGRVLGTAKADRNGEFVIVPVDRLPPGGRELTLVARDADGVVATGTDSVIVIVPEVKVAQQAAPVAEAPAAPVAVASATVEPVKTGSGPADAARPSRDTQAMAVLVPAGDGASRVLQPGSKKDTLALNTVDYDDKGEIRFSGSGKPSVPVQVYVDNKRAGETSTNAAGQWSLTPSETVAPGVHRLRVDELGGTGAVQQRVELPFQRTETAPEGLARGQAVVQPGQNLWRIARQSYGQGTRYTVIYLANRGHIRDPNLIYPGQVLAVPVNEPAR